MNPLMTKSLAVSRAMLLGYVFFSQKFGGDFRYAVTFQTKPFLAAPIRRQNYVDTGLFEFESLVQFYSVSCACEYVDFLVVSNRYKKN